MRDAMAKITFSDIKVDEKQKDFFSKHAEKWKRLNEKKRIECEETKDPSVLVDFIKAYPQALQEPWVSKVVAGWLLGGRQDLLKPVTTLGRGENADAYNRDLEKIKIFDQIEQVRQESGVTLTRAFQVVSEMETPTFKNHLSFTRIKNIYYEMDKFKPKIVCREEPDCFVLEVSPTKMEVKGQKFYGRGEWKIPK
jgi:hypothetical protein